MSLRVAPDQKQRVTLTVNGKVRSGFAEPRMLLTDFLRHELQLFGVHVGCEHGVCGACTVLVAGRAVRTGDVPSALAAGVGLLRNHGGVEKYEHRTLGFNSRLDTLQAVVLLAKLQRLAEWNAARRAASGSGAD